MINLRLVDAAPGRIVCGSDNWIENAQIKELPGSLYDPKLRLWTMPLAWSTVRALRATFGDALAFGSDITDWAWSERRNRIDKCVQLRTMLEPNDQFPCDGYDERLYPFQRVGAEFLVTANDALLGDQMGTGKTIQAIAALRKTGALPALIVCPNSVKSNWRREFETWFQDVIPFVIEGTPTHKARVLEEIASCDHNKIVVIVNFESTRLLSRLSPYGSMALRKCRQCDSRFGEMNIRISQCETHIKALNLIPFKTVIVDEAHMMKDPKSKQTRACWALMHGSTVEYRWAMTGTPIANNVGDLWSIMHGVHRSEYGSRVKFVDRYCLTSWSSFGGLNIVGLHPEHREEFDSFFEPRFRRTPKELVLKQLPPKIRTRRYVQMSPKQRKAYEEISSQFLAWVDNGNILTVADFLSQRIRLMQLASSYVKIEYDVPGDWHTMHVELCDPSPKVNELIEIICELGDKQVVVAAEQRRLIELAADRLTKMGIEPVLITGAVPQWQRDQNLRAFQSGKARVLMFTIKAGGVGLTMTAADTIVFLQRSDSMVNNLQAEDRVHRIGSERHDSVNIIDIVTEGTIEVDQIRLISDKLDRLDELTRDRERLASAGLSVQHYDDEINSITSVNIGMEKFSEYER